MSAGSDEAGRRRAEAAMWRDLSRYPGRPGMSLVDGLAAVADAHRARRPPEEPPADPATGFGTSLYPLIGLLSELLEGGYGWTVKRRAERCRRLLAAGHDDEGMKASA